LLNFYVVSLSKAKAAGIDVYASTFNLPKQYYISAVDSDGSMKYDQHNKFPEHPRMGRSIAAIMALDHLGMLGEDRFKPTLEYARKNVDKTHTHHTPQLHMMICAYTFFYLGKEDWKKFTEAYFDKIIAFQQEDGSLSELCEYDKGLILNPNDTITGRNYTTAIFSLILQVPLQNVKLK
jgi:hypothetical protein